MAASPWPLGRALLLALLLLLVGACWHVDGAYDSELTLAPQSCLMLPIDFNSTSFAFSAYLGALRFPGAALPSLAAVAPSSLDGLLGDSPAAAAGPSCTTDQVRVSRLYMAGACLASRDNQEWCADGRAALSGPLTPLAVPTSDASASCNLVFSDREEGATWATLANLMGEGGGGSTGGGSTSAMAGAAGVQFDYDTLCTQTRWGYVMLQNNCQASGEVGAAAEGAESAGGLSEGGPAGASVDAGGEVHLEVVVTVQEARCSSAWGELRSRQTLGWEVAALTLALAAVAGLSVAAALAARRSRAEKGPAPKVGDRYEVSFESEIPPYLLGPEAPYSRMSARC